MATDQPKVIDKKRVTNLLEEPSLSRSSDTNQYSIPKIQKAQPYMRQHKEFYRYYEPKLLSIGPIHHGHPNLKLGEHYKQRWTRAYFDDFQKGKTETNAAAQQLHQKLASKIEDFKMLYSKDVMEEYKAKNKDDEDLIWMLFVDGCSILHVMNQADNWGMKAAKALEIKIDQLGFLLQDILLLENQLPYDVLVLLTDDDEHEMEQSMRKLLRNHNMVPGPNNDNTNNDSHEIKIQDGSHPPAHLLHFLHQMLVSSSQEPQTVPSTPPLPSQRHQTDDHQLQNLNLAVPAPQLSLPPQHKGAKQFLLDLLPNLSQAQIRNIQELKAAGISVSKSRKGSIEAVDFKSTSYWFWAAGDLQLPEIIVDDFTAPTFMNLIAYEMCPDFHNNFNISSYVAFLDTLIDHQDDVKELRSAGVLQNHLGNDEEVAKLFNTMSTDLIADMTKYAGVRRNIKDHCRSKRNTWMAKLITEHFNSPWTIVAFVAGIILFVLTVVQTKYTIKPPR